MAVTVWLLMFSIPSTKKTMGFSEKLSGQVRAVPISKSRRSVLHVVVAIAGAVVDMAASFYYTCGVVGTSNVTTYIKCVLLFYFFM